MKNTEIVKDKRIEMEVEFKIKLSRDKDIKELCALLDKWHKEYGEKK